MPRIITLMLLALTLGGLSSCANTNTVKIESSNQSSRVSILVIHYTTGDFGSSLHALTEPSNRPVSSHYLIPEALDDSYGRGKIKLHQLVEESNRAWHAGKSKWKDRTNINDMSIGIELVNRAACTKSELPIELPVEVGDEQAKPPEFCFYPDYSEEQIALLIDLTRGILSRHPEIRPTSVIGHSDIAPERKIDPGPRFPWQRLYKAGVGAWYDNETVVRYWQQFQSQAPSIIAVQRALQTYGYDIEVTGIHDEQSRWVMRAFQMHFNPVAVSLEADIKTTSILFALIEKYHPKSLSQICAPDETSETALCAF